MASLRTTEEINLQLGSITVLECDVERKGKELGKGAYGVVFTVKYRGQTCAAKEIHSELYKGADSEKILDVFSRECCQCSDLNHPNIVKFIGVYFPKKQLLPVMLMELLDKSLTTYLEGPEALVTLMVKSSILIDIAEGLSYLHKRYPPIIHRDLTPNNILLKLPCDEEGIPIAKISDLGVSKAVETNKNVHQKLTKIPGTPDFMPPEAFYKNPVYNTSLDIFSYGGVALFVAIQVWPHPAEATKLDCKTNKLIAFTEVQRRQEYLDKMKNGAEIWRSIVEACLSNDPNKRPKITWLSERLKSFKLAALQTNMKELVYKLQQEGKSYSNYELERQFKGKWKEWMNSFATNREQLIEYPSDGEIEDQILEILRRKLNSHDELLIQKLRTIPLNERSRSLQLLINKDTHLTSTKWLYFGFLDDDDIVLAKQLNEECLTSARDYINTIKIRSKPFTFNYACNVLKDLFKIIDDVINSERKSRFEFKPEYKVDVAIAMCACVSDVFKHTTRKFKDNNPIVKLKEIKGVFLNMFKDLYKAVERSTAEAKIGGDAMVSKNNAYAIFMCTIVSYIIIAIAIVWLYIT